MITANCRCCDRPFEAERRTKRYCSDDCQRKAAGKGPRERACRHCGRSFLVTGRNDANRQHCSKECAKAHNTKQVNTWKFEHAEELRVYHRNRNGSEARTEADRERRRNDRLDMIAALGGRCVVCGVTNQSWLHIDYKDGSKDLRFRHPRHRRYVMDHLGQFRLLCANHHYELTLTGRIEGSDITQ